MSPTESVWETPGGEKDYMYGMQPFSLILEIKLVMIYVHPGTISAEIINMLYFSIPCLFPCSILNCLSIGMTNFKNNFHTSVSTKLEFQQSFLFSSSNLNLMC